MRRSISAAVLSCAAIALSTACTVEEDSTTALLEEVSSASAAVATSAAAIECTEDKLGPAADEAAQLENLANVFTMESLTCDGDWAVVTGLLDDGSTDSDDPGAPTALVFKAEGDLWVGQDKASACGAPGSATSGEAPADAAIPASLYKAGCASG